MVFSLSDSSKLQSATQLSHTDIYAIVKKLQGCKQRKENIMLMPDYERLLKACGDTGSNLSSLACSGVIALLVDPSNSAHSVEVAASAFHQILFNAENKESIIGSLVQLSLKEKTARALVTAIDISPGILDTLLHFLREFVATSSANDWMLPLLKRVFSVKIGTEWQAAEAWRIATLANKMHLLAPMILWAHEEMISRDLILDSEGCFGEDVDAWCLVLCVHALEALKTCRPVGRVLSLLRKNLPKSGSQTRHLVGLNLASALFSTSTVHLSSLVTFLEQIVLNDRTSAQVGAMILLGLAYISKFWYLNPKLADFEKIQRLEAIIRKLDDFDFSEGALSHLQSHLCYRFPHLNSTIIVAKLLSGTRGFDALARGRDEDLNDDEKEVIMLVRGCLLLGGHPKREMVIGATPFPFLLHLYLLCRETNLKLFVRLFDTFLSLPRTKEEDVIFYRLMDALQRRLKPEDFVRIYQRVWAADKTCYLRIERALIVKTGPEGTKRQAQLLRQVAIDAAEKHAEQIKPLLLRIIGKSRDDVETLVPAFEGLVSLAVHGLVSWHELLHLAAPSIATEDLHLRNIFCDILAKIIEDDLNLNGRLAVKILWAYAVDKKVNCSKAYKVLGSAKLEYFSRELLPKTCLEHLKPEETGFFSDQISDKCWLHLAEMGSPLKSGKMLRRLLKKEAKERPSTVSRIISVMVQHLVSVHKAAELSYNRTLVCLKALTCVQLRQKEDEDGLVETLMTLISSKDVDLRREATHRLADVCLFSKLALDRFQPVLLRFPQSGSDYRVFTQCMPKLIRSCDPTLLFQVTQQAYNKYVLKDKERFLEVLAGLRELTKLFSPLNQNVRKAMTRILSPLWHRQFTYRHEWFPDVVDGLARLEWGMDTVVDSSPSDPENGRKHIALYAAMARHRRSFKELNCAVSLALKDCRLKDFLLQRLYEVLFSPEMRSQPKDQSVDWLLGLVSQPYSSDTEVNDTLMEVCVVLVDGITTSHLMGKSSDAVSRFPRSLTRLMRDRPSSECVKLVESLRGWREGERISLRLKTTMNLALMSLHDLPQLKTSISLWKETV